MRRLITPFVEAYISHDISEFPQHLLPFNPGLLLIPPTLPKAMASQVLEYERRCRDGQWFLRHSTVRNNVRILSKETDHSGGGVTADAV